MKAKYLYHKAYGLRLLAVIGLVIAVICYRAATSNADGYDMSKQPILAPAPMVINDIPDESDYDSEYADEIDWSQDVTKKPELPPAVIDTKPAIKEAENKKSASDKAGLSSESLDLLKKIPADKMPISRSAEPKHNVDIKHFNANAPFGQQNTEIKTDTKNLKDVGLYVTVKKAGENIFDYMQMGRAALLAGQNESAINYYQKAILVNGDNSDALFGLAAAYHSNGQSEQARDAYIKLIMKDQNNMQALNNFFILVSEEGPEEALVQLKDLEKNNPEFAPLPAQIGMIYIEMNKPNEAAKSLIRAAILDPENVRYRYNLAVLMERTGQNKAAAQLYMQLLEASYKGKELPASPAKIRERLDVLASQIQAPASAPAPAVKN